MKITKRSLLESWVNTVQLGDCIELMGELPDNSIDTVITDPPYGVRLDEEWDEKEHFIDTVSLWLGECRRVSKRVVWFCSANMFPYIVKGRELDFFRLLTWNKPPGSQFRGASNNNIFYSSEIILLFGDRDDWNEKGKGSKQSFSVFNSRTVPMKLHGHPTTKPNDLMRWLVAHHSDPGDLILDPFMGSGSTLVAAKELDRRYIGFDLDPKYVGITKTRLVNTGLASRADRLDANAPATFEDIL